MGKYKITRGCREALQGGVPTVCATPTFDNRVKSIVKMIHPWNHPCFDFREILNRNGQDIFGNELYDPIIAGVSISGTSVTTSHPGLTHKKSSGTPYPGNPFDTKWGVWFTMPKGSQKRRVIKIDISATVNEDSPLLDGWFSGGFEFSVPVIKYASILEGLTDGLCEYSKYEYLPEQIKEDWTSNQTVRIRMDWYQSYLEFNLLQSAQGVPASTFISLSLED